MTNQFALERDLEHLVFDTINEAQQVDTSAELTKLFRPACGALCFTHIGAYSVRDPRGRMVGGFHAGTTEPAWEQHYVGHKLFADDAIVARLPLTLDAMVWSDLQDEPEMPRRARSIFQQARAFGLEDGFVLPQHYLDGAVGSAIMTSPEKITRDRRRRSAANILAGYYATGVRRLLAPMLLPARVSLSRRQRECLQWVRAGKSDWEIGEILSISEHTVKEHIEAARIKLGVRTRTQAVIEAIAQRLISL